MSTKSDLFEGCHHSKDDTTKVKHGDMSPPSVADNGEGGTHLIGLEPDASASSSIEYASICESVDTLHSAGDNWPMSCIAD